MMASPERRFSSIEMGSDSSLTRERILIVPASLKLDDGNGSQQHTVVSPKNDIDQQILELRKEQEIQKQMLWHTFQEKNKQLEMQHKLQLQHKYQDLQEQRIAAEEKLQREHRERETMRHKENSSANASPAVKQKLQNFLMNKKQNAGQNGITSPSLPYRNWGVVKSSSGESLPVGAITNVHPYKIAQPQTSMVKYDSDFPLRKTASEPNLLKIRLKQSVIERKIRIGPLGSLTARRQERLLKAAQRRLHNHQQMASANCPGSLEPGPHSPPIMVRNCSSPTSTTIEEENEDPHYQPDRDSINDLTLYTSPSMPNIPLGQIPAAHNNANYIRASVKHLVQPTNSYYNSSINVEHGDLPSVAHPINPLQMNCQIQMPMYGQPITDAQVAQARLHKQGHRPLGRTQSAPLPLGHPMLTGVGNVQINQTHYESKDAERQANEQKYLLQKIRQTVLTRAASSNRDQLKEEEPGELIDLTDKNKQPKPVFTDQMKTNASDEFDVTQQEYLHQQLLYAHSMKLAVDDPYNRLRPLARTLSNPLVNFSQQLACNIPDGNKLLPDHTPPVNLSLPHRRNISNKPDTHQITTGLAYDNVMLKHACSCNNNSSHPEHSGRLQSVWARLMETGLLNRCDRLRSRKATQEELQAVHSDSHVSFFGFGGSLKFETARVNLVRLPCGGIGVDSDTTWSDLHTAAAARMAAGCVIDLALKTAKGDINNGFAVVRPPGHHAETSLAMGFCFFNSIAIAAKILRQRVADIQRVLIVDWDVHHGNGTQQVFYNDPNVLYLSIHRHDDGNFFPGTGSSTECGAGDGIGFNVNISWSGGLNPPLGDAEYLAAFRTIVIPIAKEFSPNIVLVSAGFDAALGHPPPLGGYVVSPACYGKLTRELMSLADGKLVLALEGGYDLPAICDSAQECVKALLGDDLSPIDDSELSRPPCQNAVNTLQKTIAIQMSHWPCVKRLANTVTMSAIDSIKIEHEESDTVTAMAGLSMQPLNGANSLARNNPVEAMEQDEFK